MRQKVDCLGLGIAPADILLQVKRYPSPGAKVDGLDISIQGGGPIPTAMATLGRLGMKPSLIAAIGNDIFGRFVVDELEKLWVDTSHIIRKAEPTAIASGWVEQGSGRRTIVLNLKIRVRPGDINLDRLPECRAVHLDGRDLPACLKLARWAKRNGIPVVFDIGSMRNDVTPILSLVDHLVCAEDFALPYTGTKKPVNAMRRLSRMCPGTVVVTAGTRGSVGLESDGDFVMQKAYRVKTIDATGAGDVYHGAYIFGLLKGWDLKRRLEFASASAALKCTRPGGRLGIPTYRQVRAFLKKGVSTYA